MKTTEWIKQHLKTLSLGLVLIGATMAFVFNIANVFNANSNLAACMPSIIIICGAAGYTVACKKESKY